MKLDHVGIAVRSIQDALKAYELQLGLNVAEILDIEDQKVRVAILPSGESRIELLEPTSADSPIQKFLDRRGEGIHHLCFCVQDLEKKLEELRTGSVQLIESSFGRGVGDRKIAFLHPKSTHGVLIELVEQS